MTIFCTEIIEMFILKVIHILCRKFGNKKVYKGKVKLSVLPSRDNLQCLFLIKLTFYFVLSTAFSFNSRGMIYCF